jgi:hypothetical protein
MARLVPVLRLASRRAWCILAATQSGIGQPWMLARDGLSDELTCEIKEALTAW